MGRLWDLLGGIVMAVLLAPAAAQQPEMLILR